MAPYLLLHPRTGTGPAESRCASKWELDTRATPVSRGTLSWLVGCILWPEGQSLGSPALGTSPLPPEKAWDSRGSGSHPACDPMRRAMLQKNPHGSPFPRTRKATLPALGLEPPRAVLSPPKAPPARRTAPRTRTCAPGTRVVWGAALVSLSLYQQGWFVAQRSGVGGETAAGIGGALVGMAGGPPDGDMRAC